LRNVKVKGKEPKAIFIADDIIFFRNCNDEHITLQRVKDQSNKDVYKEINRDPSEILSKFGYNLKKKSIRNKINYVEVMKLEFSNLNKKEEINMEQIQIYSANEFYRTYVDCFATTSSQKNSSILFKLGKLKVNFENNAVDIIYERKFGNEIDDSKKKHRRAEIKKNLKGIDRFMIFSNRLPSGVHQLISIPITYFVKIKNDDWKRVLLVVDPHTAHLSLNDDEEEEDIGDPQTAHLSINDDEEEEDIGEEVEKFVEGDEEVIQVEDITDELDADGE